MKTLLACVACLLTVVLQSATAQGTNQSGASPAPSVTADARARGRSLCYDFDTFILFAWPIVLPCYLFQTRGLRAFLSLLYFAGLCLAAALFGGMVYGVLLLFIR